MKRLAWILCGVAAATFLTMGLVPSASASLVDCPTEYLMEAFDRAADLNTSRENLRILTNDGDEAMVQAMMEDRTFLNLLGTKLRLARMFSSLESVEGSSMPLKGFPDLSVALRIFSHRGSVDMKESPFDLRDFVIFQLILPMKLEPLIRELPVYYRAVVSTEDWEEKFGRIHRSLNDGPGLARIFDIAGFPIVHREPWYQKSLELELADGSLSLYEFDSSMEGWLYSFWLRRHNEGSMELVRRLLDWLNIQLDDVAGAKG
ncbi:MAG: hypothetical protein CSA35_06280 [Dethiosulfovibrio peptidovorans]|nr:MAG: hypothetical protein CSA35_06280 [Dethiosulfovibrio peptidovorans]